jgi:hypothetical protein
VLAEVTQTVRLLAQSQSQRIRLRGSVLLLGLILRSGTPTIGHGLDVAPSFIIVKDRTFAYNWDVGSDSIGWANRLNLNTTGATSSGFWNSTAPTASVFTYAASGGNSGDSMVAYCFAEVEGFSKFGSYTGNGSS